MNNPKRPLMIGLCTFLITVAAAHAQQTSEWSSPTNLGVVVNSPSGDFFPAVSKNGLSVYFSSSRPGGLGGWDIYVSRRMSVSEPWGPPQNLGEPINTPSDEGAPSLSIDGHRMYFSSNRPGGEGGNDIYVSRRHSARDDFGWRAPVNLGNTVNTDANESSPAIFDDDATGVETLYFDSNRVTGCEPGHCGPFDDLQGNGNDIYSSLRLSDDGFDTAQLVAELSTASWDRQPVVRRDGLELVFASNRPGSVGCTLDACALDLWVATRASTSVPWSTPVNLGALNTPFTDAGPALSFDGTELYFNSSASETRPGLGAFDLWVATRVRPCGRRVSPTLAATALTPPIAPCNLVATPGLDPHEIVVTWTDNSDNEDYFWVERCEGPASECVNFLPFDFMLSANETVFYDQFLPANTTYTYRVFALNDVGASAYSNVDDATTGSNPMAAPSGLAATVVLATQVTLTWIDNSDNEQFFDIEWCTGTAVLCTGSPGNFSRLATVGPNVTTYSSVVVSPNTTYSYRVRAAMYLGDVSDFSNTIEVRTPAATLNAPSALAATASSSSQIDLTWTDNSDGEDGFSIERCAGTAALCTAAAANFSPIAQVSANVTHYSNIGLGEGATYSYRVRAVTNAGAVSGYSNIDDARTMALPAAPTNLRASVSKKQGAALVTLSWTDNSPDETAFEIERRTVGTTFAQIAVVGAGVTTYRDADVSRRTTYEYRVRATNQVGDSEYSNTVSVSTR